MKKALGKILHVEAPLISQRVQHFYTENGSSIVTDIKVEPHVVHQKSAGDLTEESSNGITLSGARYEVAGKLKLIMY